MFKNLKKLTFLSVCSIFSILEAVLDKNLEKSLEQLEKTLLSLCQLEEVSNLEAFVGRSKKTDPLKSLELAKANESVKKTVLDFKTKLETSTATSTATATAINKFVDQLQAQKKEIQPLLKFLHETSCKANLDEKTKVLGNFEIALKTLRNKAVEVIKNLTTASSTIDISTDATEFKRSIETALPAEKQKTLNKEFTAHQDELKKKSEETIEANRIKNEETMNKAKAQLAKVVTSVADTVAKPIKEYQTKKEAEKKEAQAQKTEEEKAAKQEELKKKQVEEKTKTEPEKETTAEENNTEGKEEKTDSTKNPTKKSSTDNQNSDLPGWVAPVAIGVPVIGLFLYILRKASGKKKAAAPKKVSFRR